MQAKVDFYTVQRRAECTSLGLEASKHSVPDSSLAAKRLAEAPHVVIFSTNRTSPAR